MRYKIQTRATCRPRLALQPLPRRRRRLRHRWRPTTRRENGLERPNSVVLMTSSSQRILSFGALLIRQYLRRSFFHEF
eukprot:6207710-Pleurochrysis_carterae.AAC.2